jgi:hypothetical protein
MKVVDKRSDRGSKVSFAERYYSRQALGADRSDESLGKRVQMWTPGGRQMGFTPLSVSRFRKAAVSSGSRSRITTACRGGDL